MLNNSKTVPCGKRAGNLWEKWKRLRRMFFEAAEGCMACDVLTGKRQAPVG
jgi:hypothetical protein